jgi:hypothetical protein
MGMDANDPRILSAILGFAPALKDGTAGPTQTMRPALAATTPFSITPKPGRAGSSVAIRAPFHRRSTFIAGASVANNPRHRRAPKQR